VGAIYNSVRGRLAAVSAVSAAQSSQAEGPRRVQRGIGFQLRMPVEADVAAHRAVAGHQL